jgi:hypothetical protein
MHIIALFLGALVAANAAPARPERRRRLRPRSQQCLAQAQWAGLLPGGQAARHAHDCRHRVRVLRTHALHGARPRAHGRMHRRGRRDGQRCDDQRGRRGGLGGLATRRSRVQGPLVARGQGGSMEHPRTHEARAAALDTNPGPGPNPNPSPYPNPNPNPNPSPSPSPNPRRVLPLSTLFMACLVPLVDPPGLTSYEYTPRAWAVLALR